MPSFTASKPKQASPFLCLPEHQSDFCVGGVVEIIPHAPCRGTPLFVRSVKYSSPMHLKSALLSRIPGLSHGFGSRQEPIPSSLLERWNESRPILKQVHLTGVAEVVSENQNCGEVDALYTRVKDQPIAVVTADCVPLLLARRDGTAVAAVHAGWRGTRARILSVLWKRLESEGEIPGDWVAAVGPSIGPCCYEVSQELADDFTQEFEFLGKGLAVPTKRHLDLPAINEAELRHMGMTEVEVIRACTRCSQDPINEKEPRFFSYRREGGGTRQWSMISISISISISSVTSQR